MKNLALFIFFSFWGASIALAQFTPKKYVCQNPNGMEEILWIEPMPNDKGEVINQIYYQTNRQNARIQLIRADVPNLLAVETSFEVKFPQENKIYKLEYGQAGELICINPDGKKQIFLEAVADQDFMVYVSTNQGVSETLYVNYAFGIGAWYIIEYSSSKNPKRIRLQIVELGEKCKIKFPNDTQIYTLALQYDADNINNHTKHLIICTDAKGKAQTFRYKHK
jgi:hypothetical protein